MIEKILTGLFALGAWVVINIIIWQAPDIMVPTWLKIIILIAMNGGLLISIIKGTKDDRDIQECLDDMNMAVKGSPQERAIYNQLKRNNKNKRN